MATPITFLSRETGKGTPDLTTAFLSGFTQYLEGRRMPDATLRSGDGTGHNGSKGGKSGGSGSSNTRPANFGNSNNAASRGSAAANRAITTRDAKYGSTTKLKRSTERALRQSGAIVNPPVTTPNRSGRTDSATKARMPNKPR